MLYCAWSSFLEMGQAHYKYIIIITEVFQEEKCRVCFWKWESQNTWRSGRYYFRREDRGVRKSEKAMIFVTELLSAHNYFNVLSIV